LSSNHEEAFKCKPNVKYLLKTFFESVDESYIPNNTPRYGIIPATETKAIIKAGGSQQVERPPI